MKELEEQYPDPEPNDSALKLEAILSKEFGMGGIGKTNGQGVFKFGDYMGYHPDFKESQKSEDEFENIKESLDQYINSQISKPNDEIEPAPKKLQIILIPIPLIAVEKSLQEEKESSGILADYTERYLPGADLFDDRNAIGDTFSFFGRGELLQRLEENLRRGQGIGIFGLRKSGKTSLLLQLGFAMRENPLVHIDLQSYGGKPHYGAQLFNQILSKLSQLIESRSTKMLSRRGIIKKRVMVLVQLSDRFI